MKQRRKSVGDIDPDATRADLDDRVLDGPDVTWLLDDLAARVAANVPGSECGITRRNDWRRGDEDGQALEYGAASAVALPLIIEGTCIGALTLVAPAPYAFGAESLALAGAFIDQAAAAIAILLHRSSRAVRGEDTRAAPTTRSVIDQAIGIMMHARTIGSREAFTALQAAARTTNRSVIVVARELIRNATGDAPHLGPAGSETNEHADWVVRHVVGPASSDQS